MNRRLATLLLCCAAAAQAQTHPHTILTHLPPTTTNPTAQLLDFDPATAAVQPLGRFPSDTLPPLAITIDPFDWSLLVALQSSGTQTHIVRLERTGPTTSTTLLEFPLADIPGTVTGMSVQQNDLVASVDGPNGGIYRMARRGGGATVTIAQPHSTAMHGYGPYGTPVLLGWTGRPGTPTPDSGIAILDAMTGIPYLGPYPFANPTGLELTGVFDLGTAVPRQLLSFADGTFALFTYLVAQPQPFATAPVIPPGGAVAMHQIGAGSTPMLLGGAAFPYLYELDPWLGAVTVRSAALPGAPVDFVSGPALGAQALQYSQPCGPTVLNMGWSGLPQPGSTFAITVQSTAIANDHALLALGLTDFAATTLPFALPGGCLLEVSLDALILHLPPANGFATQNIAVPPGPGFLGTIVFSQWLHFDAAGISVSGAGVHQIGL